MSEEFVNKFKDKSSSRRELFIKNKCETISDAIIKQSREEVGFLIWIATFQYISDDVLLYAIIERVLPKLNRDELQLKKLTDFYSRLSIELSRDRSAEFVLKIALLCEKYIIVADPRALFYKDILPNALTILHNLNSVIEHDGKSDTGRKNAQDIIDRILNNRPPISAITSFVSMFKDIELTPQQHDILITKVSESMCKVHHQDIGNLALATFQTALFHQLLIPILALDKYFFKQRYRKEISETASDIDSIDDTTEEGVIETEEIVIYHFQNVAEYTTIERDLTNAIKPLEFTPKFILSPFISTLLVSIAKISSSVEGNFRLNQSTILPLLKQIFKFNEEHKNILRTSGWASSVDESSEIVDTDMLLKMLQQNTCGLSRPQNIALNGLFGLTFLLLKTKASPTLNKFAIDFLNEIIKKRQEFTGDILGIIIKMLFCEKNKTPIIQCLCSILQNRYLDINVAQDAMRKLIEDLTELDIDTALAIESVIFTAISKSIALRDIMIDVMKTAMYQKNIEVRKMAVFSFCVMLRKTKPSRSSFNSTQQHQQHHNEPRYSHNISFFSLTQSQIAINNVNSNMRQVEIMMLEVLGMLRKCFSETREIRVMLYESLLSSIMANTFIASNVLEFIEGHFRDYFDLDDEDEMIINFEKAYKIASPNSKNETIIIMDDLGCLLKFIINCVIIIASPSSNQRQENINCDLNLYKKVINKLIGKVATSKLSHLEIKDETLRLKHTVIIPQFLNCIEALMIYCLHESQNNDDSEYAAKIAILFEKHQKVRVITKKMLDSGKKKSDKKVTTSITKLEINSTCVWDLKECSNFLKLIVDGADIAQGNVAESLNALRADKEFHKFVWEATSFKIQNIQMAREHSKLKFSRVVFDSFLSCSELLFKQLDVESIQNIFNNFGVEFIVVIAEGFKNSSQVLESAFYNKREKFNSFLRAMTARKSSDNDDDDDTMLREVLQKIQKVVEWCFEQDKKDGGEFVKSLNGNAILCNLFYAIQIFASNFQHVKNAHDNFNWILNFSKTTSNVKQKNLAACVIKLLLQSLSQHENPSIINCVAHKISLCYKYRFEINEPENASQNNYAIISKHTVDEAFCEFIDFIKIQLNIVDVYIKRANSFNAYARLKGQKDSHIESISNLQCLEIAISTKLISLGQSLERISYSNFPLQSSRHVEKLTNIIRLYYSSMTNLMKHFRKHHDIKNISNQCYNALEELLKYSRKFAKSIYSTVKYIGDETTTTIVAVSKDNRKTKKSAAAGSSVMSKAKKTIPKVIFMLENFHKSVSDFDLAAKKNFSRLLHPGEVRDFHIDKRIVGNDASLINDSSNSDDDDTSRAVSNTSRRPKKRPAQTSALFNDTSSSENEEAEEEEELHDKGVALTRENFEDNLRKVSKGTRKNSKKK